MVCASFCQLFSTGWWCTSRLSDSPVIKNCCLFWETLTSHLFTGCIRTSQHSNRQCLFPKRPVCGLVLFISCKSNTWVVSVAGFCLGSVIAILSVYVRCQVYCMVWAGWLPMCFKLGDCSLSAFVLYQCIYSMIFTGVYGKLLLLARFWPLTLAI